MVYAFGLIVGTRVCHGEYPESLTTDVEANISPPDNEWQLFIFGRRARKSVFILPRCPLWARNGHRALTNTYKFGVE